MKLILYKIVNDVPLEKINPYFYGNEDSIATYGEGSYFTTNKDYYEGYRSHNANFSFLLEYEVELNDEELYFLEEESLPDMEYLDMDDNVIAKDLDCSLGELAQALSHYKGILVDDEKGIFIIPKGQEPKIHLLEVELQVNKEIIAQEIAAAGGNVKKYQEQKNIIDPILLKYN